MLAVGRQDNQLAGLKGSWKASWQVSLAFDQEILWPTNFLACQPADFRCSVAFMMIVFANTKGGVGKSTLAVHLAVWLFDQGMSVALLDCDKQRSSSAWLMEAEPQISCRVASTPEETLSQGRSLRNSHDFVVGDGPAGFDDLSRTLLILADLAILPVSPSILDIRSVTQATRILRYAQDVNGGRPQGKLVLNRLKTRGRISREIQEAAPSLGVDVTSNSIRSLEAFVDAAQQGTVVTRFKRQQAFGAAEDIHHLFYELLGDAVAHKNLITTKRRSTT